MPSKKTAPSLELVIEDDEPSTAGVLDAIADGSIPTLDAVKAASKIDTTTSAISGATITATPGSTIGVSDFSGDISSLIVDVDEGLDFPTWCIYGKNGTGKTTLLSTMDGMLILAPDEGTLSIREKAKGTAKKIIIDSWSKVEGVYWLVKNGEPARDTNGKPCGVYVKTAGGKFLVRAIAWDTVTSIARVCMRNVVLGAKEFDVNKDILKKTQRDWGDMSEKLKYWLQQFKYLRSLGIQNVWLFQEGSTTDDADEENYSIFPSVNQSIRIYALEEADMIMRTMIGKDAEGKPSFKISGKPNANYVTKDRTGKLSGIISNPSLEKMYEYAFKNA